MKIRYTLNVGNTQQGTVTDADDAVAEHLIRSGSAVPADDEPARTIDIALPEPAEFQHTPVGDKALGSEGNNDAGNEQSENPDAGDGDQADGDVIEGMSVKELKSFAETFDPPVPTYGTKAEIADRIRERQGEEANAED
jgi:hypothetical protein